MGRRLISEYSHNKMIPRTDGPGDRYFSFLYDTN